MSLFSKRWLFNHNVKSVLHFGSEIWRVTQTNNNRLHFCKLMPLSCIENYQHQTMVKKKTLFGQEKEKLNLTHLTQTSNYCQTGIRSEWVDLNKHGKDQLSIKHKKLECHGPNLEEQWRGVVESLCST